MMIFTLIFIILLLGIVSVTSFISVLIALVGRRWTWLWNHLGQPIINYYFNNTVKRVTIAYFSAVANLNSFLPLCSLVLNIKTETMKINTGMMIDNPFPDWSAVAISLLLTIAYLSFLAYEIWYPNVKHNIENARKKKLISINTNQLASCPYQFMGDKHIERHEISDLLAWIQSTVFKKNEDKICLLTGTAGLGKTVVLHDLLEVLDREVGYMAYGIKADQIDFSKEKIEDFISLYTDVLGQNALDGIKSVLIIDQIDALSKTLSVDRNPITLLDGLINEVIKIKEVRVIVSCRPYDLDYDPLLKKYEYRKNFALTPLKYNQVAEVLEHFMRKVPGENTRLSEFLAVPNNMQWFLEYGKDDCEVVSLQSLMDEMWSQRILDVKSKNRRLSAEGLSACLQKVTQVMNDSSSLACSKKVIEKDYSKETSYLISEHVLMRSADKKHVMFPHQSLADYVAARLAFESGHAMAEMLEKEHQGLYVRNRVKQYFAYIREAAPDAYLQELKQIVVDDTIGVYRTHIKLLLLSTLAGFDQPSDEEKGFVSRYILPDVFFRDMFVDAVYNKEWYKFITEQNLVSDGLRHGDDEIIKSIRQCSETMMYYNPEAAAEFLLTQIRHGDEEWNKMWMQVVNNNPADAVRVKLIPLYESSIGNEPLRFYNYLEKLAKERYEYVEQKILDFVKTQLEKQMAEKDDEFFSLRVVYIDDAADTLLELLFDKYKDKAAQTYLKVITLIDEVSKYERNEPGEHQESHAYFTFSSSSYYNNHDKLVHDYLEYARNKAKEQPEYIRPIVNYCLKSSQSIIFYIGLSIIRSNPNAFKTEAMGVLTNKTFLEELDGKLNYQETMLLKEIFSLLDAPEQQEVMAQIVSVDPSWEKMPMPEYRKYDRPLYHLGRRKQELLSVLPEEYLRNNWPKEWNFLQEKTRELDKPTIHEPFEMFTESGWKALNIDNMRAMPINDMLNAFRKYQSNSGFDSKPTRQGNCMNFEALVAENPSKYDDYIVAILDDPSISREYAAYGISGLKKANYDIERIKTLTDILCQQLLPRINQEESIYALMDVVRDINYFIERDVMTPIMMDFLITIIKDYKEDASEFEKQKTEPDVYNTGINRVKGSAAHQLVKCHKMKDYEEKIFDALGSCADASPATRAAIILEQAFLNNLNIDKNFRLYMALTADLVPSVVSIPLTNVHPLLYFINMPYDDELIVYFKKLFNVVESHRMLSQVLWITWVRGKEWGGELLQDLLRQSEKAKAFTLQMFQKSDVQNYFQYVKPVAQWCADSEDAEVGRMYDFLMNDLVVAAWEDAVSVIDIYSQGKVFKYAGHNFLELMKDMAGVHPDDVLRWMCIFARVDHGGDNNMFFVSSTMSILVAAYNAIRKYDKANQRLETALDTMDMLMEQKEVRRGMKHFLYELDSK